MRGIKSLGLKLSLIVIIVLLIAPHSLAQEGTVNLKAERVKYYRNEQLIKAFGDAKLKINDIEILANKMEIDLLNNQLIATGQVKIEGQEGKFDSKELKYNLKTEEGIFIESEGIIISDQATDPIYINSAQTDYSPKRSKTLDSQFTTCDLDHPHYHFQAKKMTIYPQDKIVAYHVTFWEFNGQVPIFYWPLLVYSLQDNQQIFQPQIGYNKIKGWFIKTTYNYYLNSDYDNPVLDQVAGDSGQIYIDYFNNLGFAGGFKHYYRAFKDDQTGNLDKAYLKLYLEDDKRNPAESPWISLKYGRDLKDDELVRNYTLEYANHYENYLTDPKNELRLDFDFEQKLVLNEWKNNLKIYYDKNRNYKNNLKLNLNFDKLADDQGDRLKVGLNYDLEDKVTDQRSDKYDLLFDYNNRWKNEALGTYDSIGLYLDYNLTDDFSEKVDEYDTQFDYKTYFTRNLSLDYSFDYNHYQPDEEKEWDFDNSLKLIEDKKIYDWTVETKEYQDDRKIEDYYYLPKVDIAFHPDKIWPKEYLSPLTIRFGGTNKYKSSWKDSWQEKRQYGYYEMEYSDYGLKLGARNNLKYTEIFQQNIYSNGAAAWAYKSDLTLKSYLFSNWSNELKHSYQKIEGTTSEDFSEIEEMIDTPKHKIKEKLDWQGGKSNFYLKTGYDLLEKNYDDLTSELNYHFKDYYNLETAVRYDLNKRQFKRAGTGLQVDYGGLEYNTGARLYFAEGELDKLKWDNKLDITFGEKDWQWNLSLQSSYDSEDNDFDTANVTLEKQLHRRKISLAYDHIKEEFWVQYQLLSFPQNDFKFGSKTDGKMLFDTDLGGILDETE